MTSRETNACCCAAFTPMEASIISLLLSKCTGTTSIVAISVRKGIEPSDISTVAGIKVLDLKNLSQLIAAGLREWSQ